MRFGRFRRRREALLRELGDLRARSARLQFELAHARRELDYCRPRSVEEWALVYSVHGLPDKMPCPYCGGPHDEIDHEVLEDLA